MTTTVFFVRHVPHALQDRVQVGRTEGVELGAEAPERLARVRERLAREGLAAVYASPIWRAQLTAQAIAEPHGLAVCIDEGLTEIDTGVWTGLGFEAINAQPSAAAWNSVRHLNRIPGGESMWEVQARMLSALERIRRAHPEERVAMVSHCDPIKAVLLYLLGLPLDAYLRIDVDPGSVSAVSVGDWGARVHSLNLV